MKTLVALVVATALLTLGCNGSSEPQIRFSVTAEVKPELESVQPTLRMGVVTMLSPRECFSGFRDLADYLETKLGRPVDLVFRKSYADLNELLRTGTVDLALVGHGGLVMGHKQFGMEPLAMGQVEGSTQSDGLVIVRTESQVAKLADLAGRPFAFTDPLAYTGHLAIRERMAQRGWVPEAFFSRVLFTFSHDGSVDALIGRVVDGAAVDANHYRSYMSRHPQLDGRLRVIERYSGPGKTVFVVHPNLPAEHKERLSSILLSLHEDRRGRQILAGLQVERYVIPEKGGLWNDPSSP